MVYLASIYEVVNKSIISSFSDINSEISTNLFKFSNNILKL